jgi:hypothetical protein
MSAGLLALALVAVAAVVWSVSRERTSSAAESTVATGTSTSAAGTTPSPAGRMKWQVLTSYTSHRIQNAYVPSTAHGIYVIMNVAATNEASREVMLDSDQIELALGGRRYDLDPHGLSALELAGHGLLAGARFGPAGTATGWVVFDVPPGAATSAAELCLGQRTSGDQGSAGC